MIFLDNMILLYFFFKFSRRSHCI